MVSVENFHRSARVPSAARGHAGRSIRRYEIAGHALNSGLCRVPGHARHRLRESTVERDGTPAGQHGASQLSEALDGLDPEARQGIIHIIKLHREFPAWAVWLPHAGRDWTAVRPASARAPGPDLPMIWVVHAATAAELAERMRGVDGQLASP